MLFLKLCLAAVLSTCAMAHLSAVELGNQFNLSGGYRNDVISTHATIELPTRPSTEAIDHFRVDNVDLGIVGFDFRAFLPEIEECSFLNKFYLNGFAYWGWSGKNSYERVIDLEPLTFVTQGNQKVRTEDYQIGLGYMVWSNECSYLGLVGGYANNWQRVKISSASTSVDNGAFADDPGFDGLVYTQRWQGGWVGLDASSNYNGCLINLGYEHHFSHYHGNFAFPGQEATQTAFSNARKTHNGCGDVLYINVHRELVTCLDVGLGFIYKHFRSGHAHLNPTGGTLEDAGFAEGTRASAKAKWISYSIVADIGYAF